MRNVQRFMTNFKGKKRSRLFKQSAAILLVGALLFSTILPPFAQANLWEERRNASQELKRNSSPLLAQLPSQPLERLGTVTLGNCPQSFPLPKFGAKKAMPVLEFLSLAYGSVQKISQPKNKKDSPIVVYIQDVHLNPEVQDNIDKTIRNLVQKNKVDLVALEGAFGPIDFDRFRNFPNQEAIHNVADYFFRDKKISGAVHAAFIAPEKIPPFIGVDDFHHYHANVEAYKHSVLRSSDYVREIEELQKQIEIEKSQKFNPKLKAFDEKVTAYQSDKLDLSNYLQFLGKGQRLGSDSFINTFLRALKLETSLDFSQVEKERSSLIKELTQRLDTEGMAQLFNRTMLFRTGKLRHMDYYNQLRELCEKKGVRLKNYPAMDQYLQYVLMADSINSEKLFEEIHQLKQKLYDALVKSDEEKKIVTQSRQLFLTQKLVKFTLSPEEWREYSCHSGFRLNDVGAIDLKTFESFYREAEVRDQKMAENLLKEIRVKEAQVSILVAGGFHSQGMVKKLSEAGITVIAFTPKMTHVESENGSAYLSAFTQEKTPLEKLFTSEKLSVTPSVFPKHLAKGFLAVVVVGALMLFSPQGISHKEAQAAYQFLADKNVPKNYTLQAIRHSTNESRITIEGSKGAVQVKVQSFPNKTIASVEEKIVKDPKILSSILRTPRKIWIYYLALPYVFAHELGHVLAGILTFRFPEHFEVLPKKELVFPEGFHPNVARSLGPVGTRWKIKPHVKLSRPLTSWSALLVAPAGLFSELMLGLFSIFSLSIFFVFGQDLVSIFPGIVGILGIVSWIFHLFLRFESRVGESNDFMTGQYRHLLAGQKEEEDLSDWEIFVWAVKSILGIEERDYRVKRFNLTLGKETSVPWVFHLDPQWNIIASEVGSEGLPNDTEQHLPDILEELSFDWPDLKPQKIVIKSDINQPLALLVDANANTLMMNRDVCQSPALLKFTLNRALLEMRMARRIKEIQEDVRMRARHTRRLEDLNRRIEIQMPGSLLLTQSRMVFETNPNIDTSFIQLISLVSLAEIFERVEDEGQRDEIVSKCGNPKLAAFLMEASGKKEYAKIISALHHFKADLKLPSLIPESVPEFEIVRSIFMGENPLALQPYRDIATGARNRYQEYLDVSQSLKYFVQSIENREDFVHMLTHYDRDSMAQDGIPQQVLEELDRFLRTQEIITMVRLLRDRHFRQSDVESKGILELLGSKSYKSLRNFYGKSFAEFLRHLTQFPKFIEFLKLFKPETVSLFLKENLPFLNLFLATHGAGYIVLYAKYCLSLIGKEETEKILRASPREFLMGMAYLYVDAHADDDQVTLRHMLLRPILEDFKKHFGNRLGVLLAENPAFLRRMLNLIFGRIYQQGDYGAFHNFIRDIESEAKKLDLEKLDLEWLVRFGNLKEELTSLFGEELITQMRERSPLDFLQLCAALQSSRLSLENLQNLIGQYGKNELIRVWQEHPGSFPWILVVLKEADPLFIKRVGKERFLRVIGKDPYRFAATWDVWTRLEYNANLYEYELEQWLAQLVKEHPPVFRSFQLVLRNHLPYIKDELLQYLFEFAPESLSWIAKQTVEYDQIDIIDEITGFFMHGIDHIPSYLTAKNENWVSFVKILGIKNIESLLRDCPSILFFLIEWIFGENKERRINSLKTFKSILGVPALIEWIRTDARSLTYELTASDPKILKKCVQIAKAVWGEDFTAHMDWFIRVLKSPFLSVAPSRDKNKIAIATGPWLLTPERLLELFYVYGNPIPVSHLRLALQKNPLEAIRALPFVMSVMERERWSPPEERDLRVLELFSQNPSVVSRENEDMFHPYWPLRRIFSWSDAEVQQCLAQMNSLDIQKIKAVDRWDEIPMQIEGWGQRGEELFSAVKAGSRTVLLFIQTMSTHSQSTGIENFVREKLLPMSEEFFRSNSVPEESLEVVEMLYKLSQKDLGVSLEKSLEIWLLYLDRWSFNRDIEKSMDVAEVIENNPLFSKKLTEIILSEETSSSLFISALKILISVPNLYQSTLQILPTPKREWIEARVLNLTLERLFDSIRYSYGMSSSYSNKLLQYLFLNLQSEMESISLDSIKLSRGPRTTPGEWTLYLKILEEVTHTGLLKRFGSLSVRLENVREIFRRADPALIARMAVYNIDNLQTSETILNQLREGFMGDSSFKNYLEEVVVRGTKDQNRESRAYKDALRLAVFLPGLVLSIMNKAAQSHLSEQEEDLLKSDFMNAYLENELNQLLTAHSDLVLNYPSGEGLVALSSKPDIGIPAFLSVAGLKNALQEIGIEVDEKFIESHINSSIFRVWEGVILPRIEIIESGYRGSRSFDDPLAKYITRAVTVAVRYAWWGGEAAQGRGERVIHQWSFPVLKEKIQKLRTGLSTSIYIKGETYYLKILNEGLVLYDSQMQGLGRFPIPQPGSVQLIQFPRANPQEPPIVFQAERIEDEISLLMIDQNVALANYFMSSPGTKAYVRQVSTEGLADLEVVRILIQKQALEKKLLEEILSAVHQLEETEDPAHVMEAIDRTKSALKRLYPKLSPSDRNSVSVGYEPEYFENIFGSLKWMMDSGAGTSIKKEEIPAIKELVSQSKTVQWLRERERKLKGTFEAFNTSSLPSATSGRATSPLGVWLAEKAGLGQFYVDHPEIETIFMAVLSFISVVWVLLLPEEVRYYGISSQIQPLAGPPLLLGVSLLAFVASHVQFVIHGIFKLLDWKGIIPDGHWLEKNYSIKPDLWKVFAMATLFIVAFQFSLTIPLLYERFAWNFSHILLFLSLLWVPIAFIHHALDHGKLKSFWREIWSKRNLRSSFAKKSVALPAKKKDSAQFPNLIEELLKGTDLSLEIGTLDGKLPLRVHVLDPLSKDKVEQMIALMEKYETTKSEGGTPTYLFFVKDISEEEKEAVQDKALSLGGRAEFATEEELFQRVEDTGFYHVNLGSLNESLSTWIEKKKLRLRIGFTSNTITISQTLFGDLSEFKYAFETLPADSLLRYALILDYTFRAVPLQRLYENYGNIRRAADTISRHA